VRRAQAVKLLATLSRRELQVFRRIARGERIAAIGRDLKLEHATVSTYRRRIFVKLELKTNVDIALVAHAAGIV